MDDFTIALLQISPAGTLRGNAEKGMDACREACRLGADIALFPEMWSTGYCLEGEAIHEDSPFVNGFRSLARGLGMAIAITFLEAAETGLRNSLAVFDKQGRKILRYSKVHTCEFGDESVLVPGDGFAVSDVDGVRTGAMICYDREFPESARILMLEGAEMILVPNACPMEINRLSQLRSRAFENMCAIATCNYPAGTADCNGHSTVFDGIASHEMLLLETGEGEGIFTASIDMGWLRSYRECEVHGNAYRHPDRYHALTEDRVEYPFIRERKENRHR